MECPCGPKTFPWLSSSMAAALATTAPHVDVAWWWHSASWANMRRSGSGAAGQWGPAAFTHDDGQSDIAIVGPSGTDGNPGLTVTQNDGCNFSWEEEHIEESDVMARANLNFTEPDHSFVAVSSANVGLGRAVVVHEAGHAVGLEHSSNFAIMRNGMNARVPYIGGIFGGFGSGGLEPCEVHTGRRNQPSHSTRHSAELSKFFRIRSMAEPVRRP